MKKTIHQLFLLLRKQPLSLIAIGSAILFTFILYGCRKNDFSAAPPTHEASFVKQFFALKHPVNNTVAHIIAKLKAENDRTGFVNELPANCGLPVWDKLQLKAQNNHPAFTAGGDDDTTIVIPLTNTNASLSGLLVAQPVADSLSIKCYTNNWLYNICHAISIDTNYANESLSFFMYMENQTFGTQTFYHIPAALIADGPALPDSNGTKTVTIADVTPPTEGFIINTVCIEITCPPSIAIGCMPKTVCISVPGDGAPAGGGDGTPGSGNTGTGGGQSGGGSGGNGNGPGGSTTCPLTTNVTWYGLMPPPDPCGTPIPPRDSHGFLLSRIAELKQELLLNPFALTPCDSLNFINLQTYGPMYSRIAQFIPPASVVNRLDSIRQAQGFWIVDNFNFQSIQDAFGSVVNCDYFPLKITKFPINASTGLRMTPAEFVEYFRLNINSFITPPVGVNFDCYFGPQFDDCQKWNRSSGNAIGALNHIYIPGPAAGPIGTTNSGSVILSDYQHINNTNSEQHYFKLSTLETPFDYEHPVAGNREFGIFSTSNNPNEYTFYTMGVDRVWDWPSAIANTVFDGFGRADQLWLNVQQNLKNFIINYGGAASNYPQQAYIARPLWNDVKQFLYGTISREQLRIILGC